MIYEMAQPFQGDVGTAFSSGWRWPKDQITSRHNKNGNVAFADGHVETVKPEFGKKEEHYDPLY